MSNRQLDRSSEAAAPDTNRLLRRAWVSVALIPVFFFIAFALGEGIYALMGYQPEDADAPVWAVVVASTLVVLLVVIPCVAAVHFGRRSVESGVRRGVYPAVVGAVAGVGVLALTIVTEVGDLVRR